MTSTLSIYGQHGAFQLNAWSFSQLCSLSGASRDTVNRLQPETAAQVLAETLHQRMDDETDLQALVDGDGPVRAVNGESWQRNWRRRRDSYNQW